MLLERVIDRLVKQQQAAADSILLKLKIGSPEMDKALLRYRATDEVLGEIEKEKTADDDAANRL